MEVFAGDPEKGGSNLSKAWEQAGGLSIRYDLLIDESHDFLNDQAFWAREESEPADQYHFAVPCTNLTSAKTVGQTRTSDNPYGSN